MGEVWMRSVAPICDGKLEDFKRLAQDLLSTIREKDPDELNHASFLDEPARGRLPRAPRELGGWLAHNADLDGLVPRVPEVCEFSVIELHGDPTLEVRGTRRDRPGYVVLPDALRANQSWPETH